MKIFKTLDCKGVVRMDFLYDTKNEKLYANEINTIPGSFAFYLWEPLGISYAELIDRLIGFAEKAHHEKARSNYAFESDILKKPGSAQRAQRVRSSQRPNRLTRRIFACRIAKYNTGRQRTPGISGIRKSPRPIRLNGRRNHRFRRFIKD